MQHKDTADSLESLLQEIENFELVAGTLSAVREESEKLPFKIAIRPLLLKSKSVYQVTRFFKTKAIHANLSPQECRHLVLEAIPSSFTQGIFETQVASYHILTHKNGALKVLKKVKRDKTDPVPLAHNRSKQFYFPEGEPVPFLVALGVMNAQGRVLREKYDKFRQMNHFIGLIEQALEQLPQGKQLHIIDFGSGKSYLTFALHHYLNYIKRRPAVITGVDLKEDVIADCRRLADQLQEPTLKFVVGTIQEHVPTEPVDMVIALHACDLATDAALKNAVDWQARVILAVPCCQHELLSQVKCSSLDALLRHGILKERFSALVTDAIRAELLTQAGYSVDVIEFIDLEHTSKNLMIRAVQDPSIAREHAARDRYHAIKALLHLSPWLEDHLTPKGEAKTRPIER